MRIFAPAREQGTWSVWPRIWESRCRFSTGEKYFGHLLVMIVLNHALATTLAGIRLIFEYVRIASVLLEKIAGKSMQEMGCCLVVDGCQR
jgi:hypothetical protein